MLPRCWGPAPHSNRALRWLTCYLATPKVELEFMYVDNAAMQLIKVRARVRARVRVRIRVRARQPEP